MSNISQEEKLQKIISILKEIRKHKLEEGNNLLKQHNELFHDIADLNISGKEGIMPIEKLDIILQNSHKVILRKLEYIDSIIESIEDCKDLSYAIICLGSVLQA